MSFHEDILELLGLLLLIASSIFLLLIIIGAIHTILVLLVS